MNSKRLREALDEKFSIEELAVLCADVQERVAARGLDIRVSLEEVGGATKAAQVLNLVTYLERGDLLADLEAAIDATRPGLLAGSRSPSPGRPPAPADTGRVMILVAFVSMFFLVVLIIAAVFAMVWARIITPVFLNLSLPLVGVPFALAWRLSRSPRPI